MKNLTHTLWPAPPTQDEENTAILPALEIIQGNGGEIVVLQFGGIIERMAQMVKLPFLETPEGERRYGVHSIIKYARAYKG